MRRDEEKNGNGLNLESSYLSIFIISLLIFVVGISMCSCSTFRKPEVVYEVKIVAPSLACPFPQASDVKDMPLDFYADIKDSLMVLQYNITSYQREISLWNNYKWCVETTLQAYKDLQVSPGSK